MATIVSEILKQICYHQIILLEERDIFDENQQFKYRNGALAGSLAAEG